MKVLQSFALCLLFAGATGCRAADRDFKGVVHDIEAQYHVRATHVPMFAKLFLRVGSLGGCKGLQVAEFEHLDRDIDTDGLQILIASRLGETWVLFVRERNLERPEQTLVFAKPNGESMRMLVAEYSRGELQVVRLELNPKQASKWMHSPLRQTHRTLRRDQDSEGD